MCEKNLEETFEDYKKRNPISNLYRKHFWRAEKEKPYYTLDFNIATKKIEVIRRMELGTSYDDQNHASFRYFEKYEDAVEVLNAHRRNSGELRDIVWAVRQMRDGKDVVRGDGGPKISKYLDWTQWEIVALDFDDLNHTDWVVKEEE